MTDTNRTSKQIVNPQIAEARAALSTWRGGLWKIGYAMEQFEKIIQGFVERADPTTCLGLVRDGVCSCGQHRSAVETQPAASNERSLLSVAHSYVYGGGATFADLEAAVRSAVETTENERAALKAILEYPGLPAVIYGTAQAGLRRAEEPSDVTRMRNTLVQAGYTDLGGELWKPPLGPRPAFLDENLRLRSALNSAVLMVNKLKVFGNDNVQRYDVEPWLKRVKERFPDLHTSQDFFGSPENGNGEL